MSTSCNGPYPWRWRTTTELSTGFGAIDQAIGTRVLNHDRGFTLPGPAGNTLTAFGSPGPGNAIRQAGPWCSANQCKRGPLAGNNRAI